MAHGNGTPLARDIPRWASNCSNNGCCDPCEAAYRAMEAAPSSPLMLLYRCRRRRLPVLRISSSTAAQPCTEQPTFWKAMDSSAGCGAGQKERGRVSVGHKASSACWRKTTDYTGAQAQNGRPWQAWRGASWAASSTGHMEGAMHSVSSAPKRAAQVRTPNPGTHPHLPAHPPAAPTWSEKAAAQARMPFSPRALSDRLRWRRRALPKAAEMMRSAASASSSGGRDGAMKAT